MSIAQCITLDTSARVVGQGDKKKEKEQNFRTNLTLSIMKS